MTVMRDIVLMNRLGRDLERLFAWGNAFDGSERSSVAEWLPPVDIREEETQFVLQADLPGVEAKDIDITLEKGELTIRGRRQTSATSQGNGNGATYTRVERAAGEFLRRFSLPDTADAQAVTAKHVNGVLEVVIPKRKAVLPRRISVSG